MNVSLYDKFIYRPIMTTRFRKRAPRKRRGTHILGLSHANNRSGGFMGLEMKFVDFEVAADNFASAWSTMQDGTIKCISGVAQGDGESNRDGRKYLIHSIHVKARIEVPVTESQTGPQQDLLGRICIVWDTQTNGAELTATEVMLGGKTDDELAFRNLQHTKRFRVLWDRTWKVIRRNVNEGAINLFATPLTVSTIMTFNRRFKTPIAVTTSGTGNTIAAITDNSLHMIGVSMSGPTAKLHFQCRMRFTG